LRTVEDHARAASRRGLRIALALTAVFMGLEIAGGLLSRSLALLADAGHMASDAGALGLSLFAFWLSTKPRSLQRTFGWFRFEIFAALLNGLTLWLVSGLIAWEAIRRFRSPLEIKTGPMLLVAAAGLAVNLICAWILHAGRKENLNAKGAFLHVVGDAAGSVGVIAAAVLIRFTGWRIVDPLVSLLLCGLIGWSAWRLLREAFHILMEGTPEHLNLEEIRSGLAGIPGVRNVHDLHIWTITSGFVAMTVHLIVDDPRSAPAVLAAGRDFLTQRLGIQHSTIQIESPSAEPCSTGSCD
jgi:cobalt-zinc-cadmium efflux system protein